MKVAAGNITIATLIHDIASVASAQNRMWHVPTQRQYCGRTQERSRRDFDMVEYVVAGFL